MKHFASLDYFFSEKETNIARKYPGWANSCGSSTQT